MAEGAVSGYEISPLYPSALKAAKLDAHLYELLALVAALRIGKARERKLAQDTIGQRLTGKLSEQKTG